MKGNFKATSALSLLTTNTIAAPEVKNFGDAVANEFANIGRQEKMNVIRAIMVGLGMHAVKASLKHGEFRPWLEANVTRGNIWSKATGIKNASFYMRLAIAFAEQAKPSKPELLAITAEGMSVDPETTKGNVAKLIERIEKFSDGRSLNEILVDEGIKDGTGGGGSSTPAALAAGGEDPLLADTAQHLMSLREIILDPETMKRFTAAQLRDIETQLASALEQFRELKTKLRS